MAYKAKDGKNFGNRQQQKAYDERPAKKESKAPEHAEPDADDMGSDQPIEEVVAQHGPADKIEMQHDHEGGKHTVTSHHGGHKHVAHHGSADEAHMHAAKAAGVTVPGEEQAMQPMGAMHEGGIPGM